MVTQVILTGGFLDKSLEIKYLSSFYLFSSEKANLPSYWKKGSSTSLLYRKFEKLQFATSLNAWSESE